MNHLRPTIFCLALGATICMTRAENSSSPIAKRNFSVPTNLVPLPPQIPSPVEFFRQLLVMSPRERADFLTNRPPAMREKILAKVREYQMLPPDERELRLRATELRWYLMPLMRLAPDERADRLAAVPADLRELARARLAQWDLLPPAMQQEFLANDHALHYFAHVELTNDAPADAQSENISAQFNQFFELTPAEKQIALQTLSPAERAQMEKTLQSFDQLPPAQRFQCIHNFSKFAGMSFAERAEFLKNAGQWSKLPPQERQAWRDLVAHVPEWPPMPPPVIPQNLIPHTQQKISRANVATN
jgi:hypothetical protein